MLVLRTEAGENFVSDRSKCPKCGALIHWYDNIPLVSFLCLRGKCRHCGEKISWQYPAVELATGILFLLVGKYFFDVFERGAWIETVWLLGLVSIFVAIAVYDFRTMEIPVSFLSFAGIWSILFLLLMDFFGPESGAMVLSLERTISGIAAGALAWGLFAGLSFFSKETWMGWGDAWLVLPIGFAIGIPDILFALTLAFGMGSLYGGALIFLRGKNLKTKVPFGPFLVFGALAHLFLEKIFPYSYGILF